MGQEMAPSHLDPRRTLMLQKPFDASTPSPLRFCTPSSKLAVRARRSVKLVNASKSPCKTFPRGGNSAAATIGRSGHDE